ncbi:hypothetical protein CEXT_252291 [Caerostris extrusa]|uniref:Uncharacterized protein n=1 Tax=Caerostris extrusa TaxID=172846 RepID=A0AAV4QT27_CAEEX|nr:hypothetical protein CEXT_252291 [Caerostris extrusa]
MANVLFVFPGNETQQRKCLFLIYFAGGPHKIHLGDSSPPSPGSSEILNYRIGAVLVLLNNNNNSRPDYVRNTSDEWSLRNPLVTERDPPRRRTNSERSDHRKAMEALLFGPNLLTRIATAMAK